MDEWQAFLQINGPIGDRRLDWLFAKLCWLIAEIHRASGQPPREIEDYLLRFAGDVAPQSVEEQRAAMAQWLGQSRGEYR